MDRAAALLENGNPDFFSDEASVATTQERLAALESDKKWHWWALGGASVGAFAWLLYLTTTLNGISVNVGKIQQRIADGGAGPIVQAIEHPKSDEQLAANLSLAAAQIQVARVERREPDATKLKTLEKALASATDTHPNLPETWRAALQLVDYKYESKSTAALPNCLDASLDDKSEIDRLQTADGVKDYPNFSGPQTPEGWMSHVLLNNCSLNLDDDGTFDSTSVGKFFEKVRKHHPQATLFYLVLSGAHVTYSGRKMLPISGIQFTDCKFEIKQPEELPSKWARALTAQLVTTDIKEGEVQIPL